MEMNSAQNSAQKYTCDCCNVICSKKNDWDRHLSTDKHIWKSGKKMETIFSAKYFTCKCGKKYFTNSGLWKHSKKCGLKINKEEKLYEANVNNEYFNYYNEYDSDKTEEKENEINRLTTLMIELIKSNSELQKQMIETSKNVNNTTHISNSNNNNMNNSNNKIFNLQVFLNEQCKDAMNLSDFINLIELNLTDLENMEKLGYTDCMFNNIFGNMNIIDICSRPFHCSDLKREIMYIKDNDVWEKEDAEHSKLKNAIRTIEKKNFKLLNEWTNKHPTFKDYDSPYNDKYLKIVGQTMSGDNEHMNKVIRKLAKNSVIDKSNY